MIFQCTRVLLALAGLSLMPTVALSHSGANGIVKERMEAMKLMRQDIKELRFILGSQDLDVRRSVQPAKRIAKQALSFPVMFPKGSNPPPSEALPRIWSEWPVFENKFSELAQRASTLADAAQGLDRQAAAGLFKQVQDGCETCHERYQVQDD